MAIDRWDPENNKWAFHCGGSLIDHFNVLTAAHCINVPDQTAKLLSQHHGLKFSTYDYGPMVYVALAVSELLNIGTDG